MRFLWWDHVNPSRLVDARKEPALEAEASARLKQLENMPMTRPAGELSRASLAP